MSDISSVHFVMYSVLFLSSLAMIMLYDLKTKKIPNLSVAFVALLGIFYFLVTKGNAQIIFEKVPVLIYVEVFYLLWRSGTERGGDFKLSTAILLTIPGGFYGSVVFFIFSLSTRLLYTPVYVFLKRPTAAQILRWRYPLSPGIFLAAVFSIALLALPFL
jgi:Flp pilus assembly protein protease CpaA